MEYCLQNDVLTVRVGALGAEPLSLRGADGVELLWQGDPAVWPRRAPLLFPFIARLQDETYTVDGKPYRIPIHGFAPDSVFTCAAHRPDRLTLRLTDTPATRACYPFSFCLDVTFTLAGRTLTKACTMTNRSDRPLWYELGGHEGYRVALAPGEQMQDAYVDFDGAAALFPYCCTPSLLMRDAHRTVALEDGRLYLRDGLFAQDALIMDAPASHRMTLVQGGGRRRITVSFPDFPYAAVWSHPAIPSDYVCLEPWSSLPDFDGADRALSAKRGVRCLAPGAAETLTYAITVDNDPL